MSHPFNLHEGLNIWKLAIGLELEKGDHFFSNHHLSFSFPKGKQKVNYSVLFFSIKFLYLELASWTQFR